MLKADHAICWETFYQALIAQEASSQDEYASLAEIFFDLRKNTANRLDKILGSLSKDEISLHPAFQPISLLKVLDGSGLRETAHTRILAWLFNSEEDHGFECTPIRLLLGLLFDQGKFPFAPNYILSNIEIEAERALSDGSGRRIDIWITGCARKTEIDVPVNWIVVVEAKVEAEESLDQLVFYEKEAKKWADKVKSSQSKHCNPIYIFLTREGKLAKRYKENWLPITFEHISRIIWESIKNKAEKPGFHLARLYIAGVLSDVCDWPLPLSVEKSNKYKLLEFFGNFPNGV